MSGDVPSEWRSSTVSDIAEILDSRRVPLNSEERRNRKGSIPYWGANGIVDYIDAHIFDEPLVLMAEDGGNFDEAFVRPICQRLDGRAWVNNHAHVIRPTGVIRDWFYYWFVHRDITPHIKGGTRSKLNQKDLKKLPISVPPLLEQRRIVEILSSVDEAIQATQAVIAQTRKVKQAVLEQLLTKGIGHKRFKQTEIGEIPEGWEMIPLSSTCRPRQWPTIPKSAFTENGYVVYGANGPIGKYTSYTHETSTIAVTCRGATCGTVNLVPPFSYITGNAMALDDVDGSIFDLEYLFQYLSFRGFDDVITGSAQPQITGQSISKIMLIVPPISEQKEMAAILSSFDHQTRLATASLDAGCAIKSALMSDLLTGRKRVSTQLSLAAE